MKKLLLAAALCLLAAPAWAQNPQCPNRPAGDSTNACANTRFVASHPATLVVGSSTITGGTLNGMLFNNGGVLGNTAPLGLMPAPADVVCNGVTDTRATLQAAMTAAAAASRTLVLPAGNCVVDGTLTVPQTFSMIGAGRQQTSIYLESTTATVFSFATTGGITTMSDFRVLPRTTRTSGSIVFDMTVAGTYNFARVDTFRVGTPFKTGNGDVSFDINQSSIVFTVASSISFDITGCSICTVRNTTVGDDPAARSFAHVVLHHVGGQIQFVNTNMFQAATGLYIGPGNGEYVSLVESINAYWDSAGSNGVAIIPTGTGIVRRVAFTGGSWIAGAGSNGITMAGNGTNIYEVLFDGVKFMGTPTAITAADAGMITVTNSLFGINTTAVNFTNVARGLINGNNFGVTTVDEPITTAINLNGTTDNIRIFANDFTGSTTAITDTSTGTNNQITPMNKGAYAPAGTVYAGRGPTASEIFTDDPVLGVPGSTLGTLGLAGNTSGTVTLRGQAAAGTPTVTFGTSSGTPAVTATSPLAITTATGNITCTGCLNNTPAALTDVDDTNVTLTLGGTPSTALLQAVSITAGWTGTLAASRGGTGLSALGANVATWLGTPSSANLAAAVTGETGTGALVFGTAPAFTGPMTLMQNSGTGAAASANVLALTVVRDFDSGSGDTYTGINIGFSDTGTVNPTETAALSFNSTYNNAANTSLLNFGVKSTLLLSANLTRYASFYAASALFAGTITTYIGYHATAPGAAGGAVTTKYAFLGDSGAGRVDNADGFATGGSNGLSVTKTVRASGGAVDCTLIYTGGILTGGTC